MKPIQNTFVADGRPARLGEIMKLLSFRIPDASKRGKGLRLSPEEVRALDWAVIRDSTVPNADEHWLSGSCTEYLVAEEEGKLDSMSRFLNAVAQEFGGEVPGDAWHLYLAKGYSPAEAAAEHRRLVEAQS